MKKRTLPYDGKSGILPKVKPIFKKINFFPIDKPRLNNSIGEGYADGVPLPIKKGFKFFRTPNKPKITDINDLIKKDIEDQTPKNVDFSKLTLKEQIITKKKLYSAGLLKEVYLKEFERLKKIEQLKKTVEEKKKLESEQNIKKSEMNLFDIESILNNRIIKRLTPEEKQLQDSYKKINRRLYEMSIKEERASKLIQLYYNTSTMIASDEELQKAIDITFENVSDDFEKAVTTVENSIKKMKPTVLSPERNNEIIVETIFDTINKKPGLNEIKDNLK